MTDIDKQQYNEDFAHDKVVLLAATYCEVWKNVNVQNFSELLQHYGLKWNSIIDHCNIIKQHVLSNWSNSSTWLQIRVG